MSNYTDPVFGTLDDDGHGCWSTTIAHGDLMVRADLNLDGDVDAEQVARFSKKLDDVAKLETLARKAMLADYDKKRSAEAMESETCTPASKEDIGTFLKRCELKRIALYPECPGHCMILDFGFRLPVTDYMLVVSFDGEDRVVGVDMQS